MKQKANARFAIKSWDEKPYGEREDLPKLTRASVAKTYTGDIEGEAQVEYVMMYRKDGSATFVGIERVIGRVSEVGELCSPTQRCLRGRSSEGVVFGRPRVGDGRARGPRGRWHIRSWARDGTPLQLEL
jgi:uncharacterized protein DUF3224